MKDDMKIKKLESFCFEWKCDVCNKKITAHSKPRLTWLKTAHESSAQHRQKSSGVSM